MKFFLVVLFFTPLALAEDVRRDTEETAVQQIQPVVRDDMDIEEEISAQRAQAAVRDAEEIMSQRARAAVRDAEKMMILQAPQWKNLRPEVKRIDLIPETKRIPLSSQRSQVEMYHDMSVIGKHLSNLIVSSDGALCNLSQDPLQCCNTFAQNPNQCIFEKIEKGLLDPSSLNEGVCDRAQNREGCASQVESSILLQLVTQRTRTQRSLGMRHNTFAGQRTSHSSGMDYKPPEDFEQLGVKLRVLPLACVQDPQSVECLEILEKITSGVTHNFSAGDESSPGFSIMDYPYPVDALSSPLPLELSDYDRAALRFLYSRQVGAACKDDPNSKRCVTHIEAMALHGRRLGMRHNFSASDESSSNVAAAEIYPGEQISAPSVMDYPVVENYPEIRRVMEELNGYSIEALRRLYEGIETPPAFPAGR